MKPGSVAVTCSTPCTAPVAPLSLQLRYYLQRRLPGRTERSAETVVRRRDERGSSLLMVLVVITVIALALSALLTRSDAAQRSPPACGRIRRTRTWQTALCRPRSTTCATAATTVSPASGASDCPTLCRSRLQRARFGRSAVQAGSEAGCRPVLVFRGVQPPGQRNPCSGRGRDLGGPASGFHAAHTRQSLLEFWHRCHRQSVSHGNRVRPG